ncbi:MAG: hypothetical protein AAF570_15415, partial [Bacteroidota bacterium]
ILTTFQASFSKLEQDPAIRKYASKFDLKTWIQAQIERVSMAKILSDSAASDLNQDIRQA